MGLSNLVQHSKDTANYKPIHQSPYKIGWKEQEITQSQIRQMRSAGVIEPSVGWWCWSEKKTEPGVFCVDYRLLKFQPKVRDYRATTDRAY
jgi:hypothetical protein